MEDKAKELLADMLKDLYTSRQGKFSKSTALKAMRFVGSNNEISNAACIGNWPEFKKVVISQLNTNKER